MRNFSRSRVSARNDESVIPEISQEALASMIGSTRPSAFADSASSNRTKPAPQIGAERLSARLRTQRKPLIPDD